MNNKHIEELRLYLKDAESRGMDIEWINGCYAAIRLMESTDLDVSAEWNKGARFALNFVQMGLRHIPTKDMLYPGEDLEPVESMPDAETYSNETLEEMVGGEAGVIRLSDTKRILVVCVGAHSHKPNHRASGVFGTQLYGPVLFTTKTRIDM